MKKLLAITSLALVSIPALALVSCSSKKDEIALYKKDIENLQKDIKKLRGNIGELELRNNWLLLKDSKWDKLIIMLRSLVEQTQDFKYTISKRFENLAEIIIAINNEWKVR